MTKKFVARNMLVLLAALAGGLAAIIWWLLASDHLVAPFATANREKPVVESERRMSAPVPKKSAPPPVAAATETIKGLADQLGVLKPEPADVVPKFDVTRIEPNGEAVIAGRAAPGTTIELLQDGKVHDRTVADSSGAFVFVPKPLPSGSYNLTLRTMDADGKPTVSKGAVAVTLGSNKEAKPVVALVVPKASSVVPSKPAADSEPRVHIDAVETENGGGLRVAGRSAPGSIVRLYLNDAYIATGTASPDGRIGFSILDGVKPGQYRVRIDEMTAAGSVLSRIETVFNAPVTMAEAKSSASLEVLASPIQSGSSQASSPSTKAPSQTAHAFERTPSSSTTAPRAIVEADQQISTSQREMTSAPVSQTSPRLPVVNEASSEPRPMRETVPVATGSTDQRGVVVVPKINTKVVVRGDNLWRISQATYGHGKSYTMIYNANRNLIRNPNLIFPDQIFVLPNALPQ